MDGCGGECALGDGVDPTAGEESGDGGGEGAGEFGIFVGLVVESAVEFDMVDGGTGERGETDEVFELADD